MKQKAHLAKLFTVREREESVKKSVSTVPCALTTTVLLVL